MRRTKIEQPDMIVRFKKNSLPIPLKFKIEDQDQTIITISINRILSMEKQNRGGEDMYVYQCTSTIHEKTIEFVLKYVLSETMWYLFFED